MRTAGLAFLVAVMFLILQVIFAHLNVAMDEAITCIGGQIMGEGTVTTFEIICERP